MKTGEPQTGIGVYHKQRHWALLRHRVFMLTGQPSPVRVFLVHGHDDSCRDELQKFAEDELKWEVTVLGQRESHGLTWIRTVRETCWQNVSLAWCSNT